MTTTKLIQYAGACRLYVCTKLLSLNSLEALKPQSSFVYTISLLSYLLTKHKLYRVLAICLKVDSVVWKYLPTDWTAASVALLSDLNGILLLLRAIYCYYLT